MFFIAANQLGTTTICESQTLAHFCKVVSLQGAYGNLEGDAVGSQQGNTQLD
jgi:hypothetical protein